MSVKPELLLSEDPVSHEQYRRMMEKTISAILDASCDAKGYRGLSPDTLREGIRRQLLPERGRGYDAVLDEMRKTVLPNFVHTSSENYMAHLHSPALMESLASELILSTFNQSMDSWDQAPIATEIEVEVIRQLDALYGYGEEADGAFTSGGTQSNLSCLFLARDWYCDERLHWDVKRHGLPDCYRKLRIYTSEISHFSMEKSAHLMGLGYEAVVKVPVDDDCRMDVSELRRLVEQDLRDGNKPMCVVATVGTTDYGSIDPVGEIASICNSYGMWCHADAAYGSAAILSEKYKRRIGDLSVCDSITVDFHKMFLLPISCSAILVKDGRHMKPFMLHADYLNREEDEEDGYTNLVGKSLQTTRRFDALKVWVAFQSQGRDGYETIVDTCIENAAYVYGRLREDIAFEVVTRPELSSVVFRLKDADDEKIKAVRRKLLLSGVVIGQTTHGGKTWFKFTLLNPRVTHGHLDQLLETIKSA
ncbi:MAG: aspartate aminotransferase family protein [Sphaerochaetaceae bacterium]